MVLAKTRTKLEDLEQRVAQMEQQILNKEDV
jgi:BMFP domain-containing protein YqiC